MTNLKERATEFSLPEGCEKKKVEFRIAHVSKDMDGNYSERHGWLLTDVLHEDKSRACIRYDNSPHVVIDVPSTEIVILNLNSCDK